MSENPEPDLRVWIGRHETTEDLLTLFPAQGLAALLDRDPGELREGSLLPNCWHWLYFKPVVRRSGLGEDGHPHRGGFLPPVTLPHRMWVGGRLRFDRPLRLGDRITRRSEIKNVVEKEGRAGKLVFVTVEHTIAGADGPAIHEEQDLVYRGASPSGGGASGGKPVPEEAAWSETFLPDPVALFRYSALTFNGHRIHYDHLYATGVEGYPGLVVHGPLTATLLIDAATRQAGRAPASYTYQAVSPLFCNNPVTIAGRSGDGTMEVWAGNHSRQLAMTGTVGWVS